MNPNTDSLTEALDIAVIGLGYVGMPLALALACRHRVLAFDIDVERIANLAQRIDTNGEISADELAIPGIKFSADPEDLNGTSVFIIAVPTPVDIENLPDLRPLLGATKMVGQALAPGNIVIFESTVYPGATEDECVPVLESASGLILNETMFVGYSPERINPGDKGRKLADIVKVTSGSNEATSLFVDALYRQIVPAGTHRAPSIRVAEAAKAVENTQRDINIAFANELAMILNRLGIDTEAVLEAAGTKWNFMPVRPGLVGGHCIGVDPYYLIHKAESCGANPRLIRAARAINEHMSGYVVDRVDALMTSRGIAVRGAIILVLGLTFKENCADLRNTRVVEIVQSLSALGADVAVHDPWCDPSTAQHEYGITIRPVEELARYDAIILAVAHDQFRKVSAQTLDSWRKPNSIVFDVKGILRHHRDVAVI